MHGEIVKQDRNMYCLSTGQEPDKLQTLLKYMPQIRAIGSADFGLMSRVFDRPEVILSVIF
jgi:hypothetical protein